MARQYPGRAARRQNASRRYDISIPATVLVTVGLLAVFGAILFPTIGAIEVASTGALASGAPLVPPSEVARSISLLGIGAAALSIGTALSLARMA